MFFLSFIDCKNTTIFESDKVLLRKTKKKYRFSIKINYKTMKKAGR